MLFPLFNVVEKLQGDVDISSIPRSNYENFKELRK